jgi:deoxyhypusine synthase
MDINQINHDLVEHLYQGLEEVSKQRIDQAISKIVQAKERGRKVVVVTGSGPNIHEGITTLIAELIKKKIVDGVITSSAVIAHEMAGSLDKVKRLDGKKLGICEDALPKESVFEITLMDKETLEQIKREMLVDVELIEKALELPGDVIIKAAGNMGYPMGLRTERIAREVESLARLTGKPFEYISGLGADERTMIGTGVRENIPVIVSAVQLIGGGVVGLSIGDSISFKQRSAMVASILNGADVIVESGVALTQEIHDGPFETYTGHGIWSAWEGAKTFSLKGKTLIRIDLDPSLEKAWQMERKGGSVQKAIDEGLPKTKFLEVPFRMEMSGFARLEDSIPIREDLGVVWPVITLKVSEKLGRSLDFLSYPQETSAGKKMREWIVNNVKILNRELMYKRVKEIQEVN